MSVQEITRITRQREKIKSLFARGKIDLSQALYAQSIIEFDSSLRQAEQSMLPGNIPMSADHFSNALNILFEQIALSTAMDNSPSGYANAVKRYTAVYDRIIQSTEALAA
ncbi:MAG: hypothetical protein AABX11_06435 [Nanoarchaeota archaeon]